MNKAIGIIYDEHRSISAVLSGLKSLARMAGEGKLRPEFAVFRAMIYYIDAFPERMHHPKEDKHLFARLLERDPGAGELIGKLQVEHVVGAKMVRDLEQSVLEYEQTWPRGAEKFMAVIETYAQFHWNHMRCEEREVIPRAEKALLAEDWAAIEAAFAGNNDPIADLREQDFHALYQRILSLAPAPVGLGERWKPAL
ncbi:MAG: hemerythrin domain-containing protein [Betaproteobacteria bacterium]